MNIDMLHRLRDVIRRKGREKWRTSSWFVLHDNAAGHRSVLVKNFLARYNVTILAHPPYSPGLATADVYPLRRLKSALKEWCLCDATDIIGNATEELKRLQNVFQGYFQHVYSHWQKCTFAQED